MAGRASFTLASFNTHWGLDRHNRPFDVVAACRRLDADVIALQEVWRPDGEPGVARAVAGALGYELLEVPMGAGGPHGDKGLDLVADPAHATGTWGVALLSRFPMAAPPTIDLPAVPLDRANRRALVAGVAVPAGGGAAVDVRVVCAHLTHRLWGSLSHLGTLRRGLDDRPARPTVVTGDMNMWGPVVDRTLPGLRRALRAPTWPAHRPHSQIDHILVSADVEVVEARRLDDAGSDHRPVWARLSVTAGSVTAESVTAESVTAESVTADGS